jgi:hypothetical protein
VDVGVFRQGEFDDGLFGGFAEEKADGGGFVGDGRPFRIFLAGSLWLATGGSIAAFRLKPKPLFAHTSNRLSIHG